MFFRYQFRDLSKDNITRILNLKQFYCNAWDFYYQKIITCFFLHYNYQNFSFLSKHALNIFYEITFLRYLITYKYYFFMKNLDYAPGWIFPFPGFCNVSLWDIFVFQLINLRISCYCASVLKLFSNEKEDILLNKVWFQKSWIL